ncbi:MAG: uracil-DNA glycosylase [Pseudomonadota bacterium]|nr:uracil-DNA glycosylase [Pseudomonadota bacterium]
MFDPACRRCPRLSTYRDENGRAYPHYHNAPVPAFGSSHAHLLIVGLAPGLHGANATGRPFTGDYAGELLYRTLHEFGFSAAPESRHAGDGLRLRDCRITNAVRCVPPQNRPAPEEVRKCLGYLKFDLDQHPAGGVVLALGRVAHETVLRALGLRLLRYPFGHGARHDLPDGRILLSSYHCSRYNTSTRRLTPEMFRAVMAEARELVGPHA